MLNVPASDGCAELANQGFTWVIGQFATPEEAWQCASEFIGTEDAIDAPIEVIGNFVIPPLDGSPRTFKVCTSISVCRSTLWRMQM